MSLRNQPKETFNADWNRMYRVAAIGVLLSVIFIIADMALTAAGQDPGVGRMTARDWFANFNHSPLVGLRNFGIINVLNTLLAVPLYLALYALHRKSSPAFGALALIIWVLGTAVYVSNNRALSMLELSHQFSAAESEAQKMLVETAGTAIMAQAEDFTPGSFTGFFLSMLGSMAMMLVMLRGQVFSKAFTLAGLVGSGCLMFFTIAATFVREIYDLAMIFAGLGGLLLIAWDIYMVVRLFRLAGDGEGSRLASHAHKVATEGAQPQ